MNINIEIVDRNYEQIKEFCEYNNILVEDYIVQCVEDDFFTRKYGDLNEKLKKKEEKTEKVEESPKTEKKKVGRPRKKVEEPKEEPKDQVVEDAITNTNQILIKKEEVADTNNKKTTIRRTLKAK